MIGAVPGTEHSNGHPRLTDEEQGVLANLPRTRPQRTTRRRLAARGETRTGASATAEQAPPREERGERSKPERERTPRTRAHATREKDRATADTDRAGAGTAQQDARAEARTRPERKRAGARSAPRRRTAKLEPAPRQGFESESERPHAPVQPPGGVELLAGAAELVGELTRAGVSAGERVLKDMLSRLPL